MTVSFWAVIGLLWGHTCKKMEEKSCDGVVLGCDWPALGTHMQEIVGKVVGVW